MSSLFVSWVDVEERTWEISLKSTLYNLRVLAYHTPHSHNLSFFEIKVVTPNCYTIHQYLSIRIDDYLILEILHSVYSYIFYVVFFLLIWLDQSIQV